MSRLGGSKKIGWGKNSWKGLAWPLAVSLVFSTAVLSTAVLCTAVSLQAQSLAPTWRQVGNFVIERSLAGPAGGPVARVWYATGQNLWLVQAQNGRVFQTADLDTWQPSDSTPPVPSPSLPVANLPEPGATVRAGENPSSAGAPLYAFGKFVWRSEDGGAHWENKTSYRGNSLIGNVNDLAVNPSLNSADEVTAGTSAGVFHSADGGTSWSGLNEGLPNLPAARLWALPSGNQGVVVGTDNQGTSTLGPDDSTDTIQWEPGQKAAWLPSTLPASNGDAAKEVRQRAALSLQLGKTVTAVAAAGNLLYTGMHNGELAVSPDGGITWASFTFDGAGPAQRFWVSPQDPRMAVAVLGASSANPFRTGTAPHILRTLNGGAFWDDITGNLPDAAANGVTVDVPSKAIYAATAKGVYLSYTDLNSLGPAATWTKLEGLPNAAVTDARLDAQGNQLWVTLDGYGVYLTLAPHRLRDPRVVSAADMIAHAVAPGSLLSVLGAKLDTVRVGNQQAPVLASSAIATEIQIPFEARADAGGNSLTVSGTSGGTTLNFAPVILSLVSPVIFVSADGSPMLLDAEQGIMLDATNSAHSGTSIQILASGLGRVTPEWPSGLAAPLSNPPKVSGAVHAYLDRVPVEVTRATLAPGYVGFYLIEVRVPKIVNYGPAELLLDVGGIRSNPVRVYIEP